MTGLGGNDLADIVANLVGPALGTSTAVLTGWAADTIVGRTVAPVGGCCAGSPWPPSLSAPRCYPGSGAAHRQAALADEARQGFIGTSLTDAMSLPSRTIATMPGRDRKPK